MNPKTSENIDAFLKKVKPRSRRSIFWSYLDEIEVLHKAGCSLPQICDYLKQTHGVCVGVTSNNLYSFLLRTSNNINRGVGIPDSGESLPIGLAISQIQAAHRLGK